MGKFGELSENVVSNDVVIDCSRKAAIIPKIIYGGTQNWLRYLGKTPHYPLFLPTLLTVEGEDSRDTLKSTTLSY